jgi:mannose/fructose-specific phosphotransferase system component IIA
MTLSYPVLLVSHRGFAEGLLAAAEAILGERPPIDHLSNEDLSTQALTAAIERWLDAQPGPAVILTDLGFGSCCQSARLSARGRPGTAVIAGVNLPVILALVRSSAAEEFTTFVRHLTERGRTSVESYLEGNPL